MTGRDVADAQVVRVASANGRRTHTTAQQFIPAIERGSVQLWPWAVPDLHGVKSTVDRVLPWRPERFRVVDAHDRAARRGGAHRSLHRFRFGLAELPPPICSPHVPVPAVCGHLDPRDHERLPTAPWPIRRVVSNVVVVSDTEEVEARRTRGFEHLDWRRITVRRERVAVETAP